ncbi:hypothetical protein [Streptomyces monomycini]|uniref:hypothetical protein n=1 Tax=Streptomyces monomycini TaxID=371720 RepID=UPI000A90551C|nr:hypothetical protein [Streptomyces monomycini]
MTLLQAGVTVGAQVWVLHEGTLLRGAAVTTIDPTVNFQWHQDPDSESLWLQDMYTDPDAQPPAPESRYDAERQIVVGGMSLGAYSTMARRRGTPVPETDDRPGGGADSWW